MSKHGRRRYSAEDKAQLVRKFEERRESGEQIRDIAKDLGLHVSSFYIWKKMAAKKKSIPDKPKKVKHHTFPINHTDEEFVIKGSPESVARFMRELSRTVHNG